MSMMPNKIFTGVGTSNTKHGERRPAGRPPDPRESGLDSQNDKRRDDRLREDHVGQFHDLFRDKSKLWCADGNRGSCWGSVKFCANSCTSCFRLAVNAWPAELVNSAPARTAVRPRPSRPWTTSTAHLLWTLNPCASRVLAQGHLAATSTATSAVTRARLLLLEYKERECSRALGSVLWTVK